MVVMPSFYLNVRTNGYKKHTFKRFSVIFAYYGNIFMTSDYAK